MNAACWRIPRWIHVPWFIVALVGWSVKISTLEHPTWMPIWRWSEWCANYDTVYWTFCVAFFAWYVLLKFGRLR